MIIYDRQQTTIDWLSGHVWSVMFPWPFCLMLFVSASVLLYTKAHIIIMLKIEVPLHGSFESVR